MDNLSILEEIGLKKVSNKTHIEVKHLVYMINSEFDKLDKTSTVGFVKILSREYNLDLTDWLNEAQRYWSENKKEYSGPKIFIVQKRQSFLKTLFMLLSMVVLVAILYGAYMFLNNKLDFFENPLIKKDANYTYEETPVVNEAKESLDINTTQNDENSTIVADENGVVDENDSDILPAQSVDVADEVMDTKESNSSVKIASEDSNLSVSDVNKTDKNMLNTSDDFISPKTKLWIGVIYLDNFKRKSYLGDENFTIDASRDQLITTGHGNFVLHFNAETKEFPPQKPVKLYIKDGEISVITDKKFQELNRGSIW
jgi:cytoskeletal protein RodZ